MPRGRLFLYLATVSACAVAVRSVFRGPPPLYVALAMALAYTGTVLGGVFVLRWQMFVDAVVRGPGDSRGFALTFDDGPDPKTTPRVLDALEKATVTATFFVIGRKAEAHPELVREILSRGHAIGLHSYEHLRLFALCSERTVRRDLERGIFALKAITGERPTLFRPPIGHTNPIIGRVADELNLTIVGWSATGHDGLPGTSPDAVLRRVTRGLRDGAIVLLHDAAERGDFEPVAHRVVGELIARGRDRGLSVVPLGLWTSDSADTRN